MKISQGGGLSPLVFGTNVHLDLFSFSNRSCSEGVWSGSVKSQFEEEEGLLRDSQKSEADKVAYCTIQRGAGGRFQAR